MKNFEDNARKTVLEIVEKQQKFLEPYSRLQKQLSRLKLPKFNVPKLDSPLPDLKSIEYINPDIQKEKNNWKRHADLIESNTTLVAVLETILQEQRKGTVRDRVIIGIAILTLTATIIGIIL